MPGLSDSQAEVSTGQNLGQFRIQKQESRILNSGYG